MSKTVKDYVEKAYVYGEAVVDKGKVEEVLNELNKGQEMYYGDVNLNDDYVLVERV